MWHDKIEVKKGDVGERIVDDYFRNYGYIIYTPEEGSPHLIDRYYIKDKDNLFFAEVKTKPKRNNYPDTGFDYRHYEGYKILQDLGHKVCVFFVDEVEASVYGNTLSEISKPSTLEYNGRIIEYPLREGELIYFRRDTMKEVTILTQDEVMEIRGHESRNYPYEIYS